MHTYSYEISKNIDKQWSPPQKKKKIAIGHFSVFTLECLSAIVSSHLSYTITFLLFTLFYIIINLLLLITFKSS